MTSVSDMIWFMLLPLLAVRSSPAPAPAPELQLPPVLQQGLYLGNYSAVTTNNKLFLPPPHGSSQRALCDVGPSVWCQSPENQEVCGVSNTTVGVCGYGTTRGNCTVTTIPQFCANSTLRPLTYNGGLNGAPQGNLGLLVLALYWAPTSCKANGTRSDGGYCSAYTSAGNPAATNLMLHGLWPDTGSLYAADPSPPAYKGAYQGWTQYCSGPDGDYFQCSVNGNLCSLPNATSPRFSQAEYETCMRTQNVTQCLVGDETLNALLPLFKRYAPGYIGNDGAPSTFLDHEFNKHGSCIGGHLTRNKTAFFERAVWWAANVTNPGGSAIADLVQSNVGNNVTVASLQSALGRQGTAQCQTSSSGLCKLSEIWLCLGVDAAGYPTQQIDCPSGSQLGTCDANKCANSSVLIPSYTSNPTSPSAAAGR